ncbi:hypothetical protein [Sphingobium yanoikuyae]|nr:hypothetical protein [Sphingobium yanoikuyae]
MRFSHQCHKSEIECDMQISLDSNRIMDAQKAMRRKRRGLKNIV